MKRKYKSIIKVINIILFLILITNCSNKELTKETPTLNKKEQYIADSIGISYDKLQDLKQKQLYTFSEEDVNVYLKYLAEYEPDLKSRIKHLGLKNIGQPYELYLLGEYPFGIYDLQPLYCIKKSDCVVFVEQTLAMALANDWNSFFKILQKIRYKDGNISLVTRNHYATLDWNQNNSWLVTDTTDSLGGSTVKTNKTTYNKNRFFSKWNLNINIPKESFVWNYIPADKIDSVKDFLQTGDIVQIVRGRDTKNGKWVGHFGMIIIDDNGKVNLLHSTPPKVKIQSLMNYVNNEIESNSKKKQINAKMTEVNKEIKKYNKKLQKSIIRKHIVKPKKEQRKKTYFFGLRFLRLNSESLKNSEIYE